MCISVKSIQSPRSMKVSIETAIENSCPHPSASPFGSAALLNAGHIQQAPVQSQDTSDVFKRMLARQKPDTFLTLLLLLVTRFFLMNMFHLTHGCCHLLSVPNLGSRWVVYSSALNDGHRMAHAIFV